MKPNFCLITFTAIQANPISANKLMAVLILAIEQKMRNLFTYIFRTHKRYFKWPKNPEVPGGPWPALQFSRDSLHQKKNFLYSSPVHFQNLIASLVNLEDGRNYEEALFSHYTRPPTFKTTSSAFSSGASAINCSPITRTTVRHLVVSPSKLVF